MKNILISNARKLYWSKFTPEEKTKIFSNLANIKHAKETPGERLMASKIMYGGKFKKDKLLKKSLLLSVYGTVQPNFKKTSSVGRPKKIGGRLGHF